jgi:hypothetical protein
MHASVHQSINNSTRLTMTVNAPMHAASVAAAFAKGVLDAID